MKKLAFLLGLAIFLSNCSRENNLESAAERNNEAEAVAGNVSVQESNKIMYVNAPAGLRVRNSPNINAEMIGVLGNLTEVLVLREDENNLTIDGIEGKWTFIETGYIQGWVFGGFLVSMYPSHNEIIIHALEDIFSFTASIGRDVIITHIEKINIGISNIDCYIAIVEIDEVQLSFHFFGIQNDTIIINESLGWGFIAGPQFDSLIISSLSINSNFTQVGAYLVFIGDINRDGNDDIIIVAALEYGQSFQIFGVNKKRNNITTYLSTHFQIREDLSFPIIVENNGHIKVNRSIGISDVLVNSHFIEFVWDEEKYGFIEY